MSRGIVLRLVLGICGSISIALPVSAASIRYDLRAVQDGTVGARVRDNKNVEVSSPRGVVKMQLWAMVSNSNRLNEDDQFQMTQLSFLSAGGDLRGDLMATSIPFFVWGSAEPGRPSDLDGDGDLDVGENRLRGSSNAPWPWFTAHGNFRPWSAVPEALKQPDTADGRDFSSFHIGSLEFSFDNVDLSSNSNTTILPRPRVRTDGLIGAQRIHQFREDGQYFGLEGTDSRVTLGDAVTVTTSLVSAVPEPGTWLLAAIGCLVVIVFRQRWRISV